MDWCNKVVRSMQVRLARTMVIAVVTLLYVMLLLPLPYLLVEHYSATQTGDSSHSDVDVHAWLEWATGSSLSGTSLVLSSTLLTSAILPILSVQGFSNLLVSVPYSRGPPAAV
jgi:hypothetical protein